MVICGRSVHVFPPPWAKRLLFPCSACYCRYSGGMALCSNLALTPRFSLFAAVRPLICGYRAVLSGAMLRVYATGTWSFVLTLGSPPQILCGARSAPGSAFMRDINNLFLSCAQHQGSCCCTRFSTMAHYPEGHHFISVGSITSFPSRYL